MAKPNKAKTKAPAKKSPAPKKAGAKKHAVKAKAKPAAKAKSVSKPAKPAKAKPVSKAPKSKPLAKTKPAAKKIAPTKTVKPLNGKTTKPAVAFVKKPPVVVKLPPQPKVKLTPFLEKQRNHLLQLRDGMLDSMLGVAKDNLRSRAEGSEASAFGMHQADAGSDAYDRDFALNLLSQEQDALYEIDEALKRIDAGTYGTCEMSGKPISHARLEAIPFARCTVECQSQLEKQNKLTRTRVPVTSLFGLTDDEGGDSEEEEPPTDTKE
jgi:RNA polymerase-binding transcription factor DksA